MRKIILFFVMGVLLMNLYGCFALFVGAAAGTGTAFWLSDKLTQQFNTPYEQTINAAKKALSSLKLEVIKETKDTNVAQLRSKYSDGKDIWIDVRKITESSTKVDVRVGAVHSDKAAAENILRRIKGYL